MCSNYNSRLKLYFNCESLSALLYKILLRKRFVFQETEIFIITVIFNYN